MKPTPQWPARASLATLVAALICSACSNAQNSAILPTEATGYSVVKLVGDAASSGGTSIDANLVNPWGMAFGPTGILWVANNHTGTSSLYDANGVKQSLVVNIPTTGAASGGSPTGVVYNSTSGFIIPGSTAALFIYCGEDGIISAWNAAMGSNAVVVADQSANNAVYKGLAIAASGGVNYLYATNFKQGRIDVFGPNFQVVTTVTDLTMPTGFAPFGIQNIGGKLYVTYAKQLGPDNEDDDPAVGNGYVVVFNLDGTPATRFASNGKLNSPWGIALAPAGFGSLGGDLLIGNFGDGLISAYDATTGVFKGLLEDSQHASITIPGLWGLLFGSSSGSTTLYFTSGPNAENHGLLGTLKPN